jgi:hypothetical protein
MASLSLQWVSCHNMTYDQTDNGCIYLYSARWQKSPSYEDNTEMEKIHLNIRYSVSSFLRDRLLVNEWGLDVILTAFSRAHDHLFVSDSKILRIGLIRLTFRNTSNCFRHNYSHLIIVGQIISHKYKSVSGLKVWLTVFKVIKKQLMR